MGPHLLVGRKIVAVEAIEFAEWSDGTGSERDGDAAEDRVFVRFRSGEHEWFRDAEARTLWPNLAGAAVRLKAEE
jgi:hypothetical protein